MPGSIAAMSKLVIATRQSGEETGRIPESQPEPFIAGLFEVGQEDHVVDMPIDVEVAPANLDLLLVLHVSSG